MTRPHIVVVGSGSLARAVCQSLAGLANMDSPAARAVHITCTVLARNLAETQRLVTDCQVRASVANAAVTFAAGALDDEVAALARRQPDVVVCCASAQSPYEAMTAPSAWTRLVKEAGFGVTLPLQATVTLRLANAIAQASPHTLLVNGCFPDAVNPLLAALDRPVHCGIGNVATIAACLQAAMGLPDQSRLSVLAHHVHLAAPGEPDRPGENADEALA